MERRVRGGWMAIYCTVKGSWPQTAERGNGHIQTRADMVAL
jgi:hypothetical protein